MSNVKKLMLPVLEEEIENKYFNNIKVDLTM